MECRCPSCHAFVRSSDDRPLSQWLTCWFCDRGFRPEDARCASCTGPLPLGQSCACAEPQLVAMTRLELRPSEV
jgi:hypothetical protein